jgi:hypothetical protein
MDENILKMDEKWKRKKGPIFLLTFFFFSILQIWIGLKPTLLNLSFNFFEK